MIKIEDKVDCCGCSACAQSCPIHCITMSHDNEGFVYPQINTEECIDCRLCENVCPLINVEESKKPIKVYAAKNINEEIRLVSSSGGVFTALAENTINKGGVVFGVTFDKDWNTVHTYTESIQGLSKFRGSKYVQSKITSSYYDVKSFLKSGREVLFSGTPCQIAGLKRYLKKEYSNLLTVEILCHGVPSPKVWQKYLQEKKKKYNCDVITKINFRNKQNGWFKYHITIEFQNGRIYDSLCYSDIYFSGFLSHLYMRPSCYSCKCKNGRSKSDVSIADYWNINEAIPGYNDDKGVSLVLPYTEKGSSILNSLANNIEFVETEYDVCKGGNGGFTEEFAIHKKRTYFFNLIDNEKYPISVLIKKCIKRNLLYRIKNKIKRIFKH